MFGISWTEFLVILLVAICVVPVKNWPDVVKFFARICRYIRDLIWKISDFSEQVQQRIELEKPIDDLITNAATDFFDKPEKSKKTATKKKSKNK